MSLSPFDIIKAARNQERIDVVEKEYVSYIINRALSFDRQSILLANEMNKNPLIEKQWQYDFYRTTLRPQKKFTPWIKAQEQQDLDLIIEMFEVSIEKAKEIDKILSEDQKKQLQHKQSLKRQR